MAKMIASKQEVLDALDIKDYRHPSRDKLMDFLSRMDLEKSNK